MNNLIHKFEIFDKYIVLDVNSGSVLEVDDLIYNLLEFYGKCSPEDAAKIMVKYSPKEISEGLEEIKSLADRGILFTKANLDFAVEALGKRKRVKALCLNVAHDCNLRCTYCFASKGDYQGKRELMSKEAGRAAVDFLVASSGTLRNLEIDFFGGEPLMAIDTVKEVVSYSRSLEKGTGKTFHFTITTNGMLLTDENILYLHENMDNIVLSIDGRKEINDAIRVKADGSGSYDQIVGKIGKMVELRKRDGKEYYVRGTFTKGNLDFAKDVFHLANLGFSDISIEPVVGKDGDFLLKEEDLAAVKAQYDEIAKEYIKRKALGKKPFTFYHFKLNIYDGPCLLKRLMACGAGREYLAVTPSGEIYPCHQFVGNDEFVMGNVFDNIISEEIVDLMKDTHVFAKDKCCGCWARFYCSGGCNANNFVINGDMNVPYDITCELQKSRIEYAIYLNISHHCEEC